MSSGQVSEARIDVSVRRILRDKFRLGLFDDPYVDVEAAERIAGRTDFRRAGELAQRGAIVLLKNGEIAGARALPLSGRPRLYVEGIEPQAAGEYGQVVEQLEDAEVAILRLDTPYEPREGFLKNLFRQGDLDFKAAEKERILDILARVPTLVAIHLERAAVIPEIAAGCAGLLAEFGASDEAILDVVFGRFAPAGRLPFELPSSMEAVRNQNPDLPYDSKDPLFPFGHGLSY